MEAPTQVFLSRTLRRSWVTAGFCLPCANLPSRVRSFTQLSQAIRGIATNILSDRLRTLVSEGILTVTASESDGRRSLYSLTSKGFDLEPFLVAIELWAKKYERV